jgi:hypothetical protein
MTENEVEEFADDNMPLNCEVRRIVEISNVYHSDNHKHVSFFAEKEEMTNSWMIVCQVEGYQASEYWDDWFKEKEFADKFAKDCAKNYIE